MVGKRKILLAATILITALIVVYFKNDIPPNLKDLMTTIYMSFVVGNGFEHYASTKIVR